MWQYFWPHAVYISIDNTEYEYVYQYLFQFFDCSLLFALPTCGQLLIVILHSLSCKSNYHTNTTTMPLPNPFNYKRTR